MSLEELTLVVPTDLAGKRLDQVLAKLCPQHSRSRLQSWIRSDAVTVNGNRLRQRDKLHGGETIKITVQYSVENEGWSKQNIPVDIVFEDEHIIVLNKPVGLVVHPGAGNQEHTLLNALLYHRPELEHIPRAGIIQRLDKDTSGLMVVTKTLLAHTWLVDQLQKRLIQRQYQAIVQGVLTSGGSVDAPIGRHPLQRKRMAVIAAGKDAVTHYHILRKFTAHTHVRLELETGRTHQIRVHMAHIKHPIVGDPVYAGRMRLPKNSSTELRTQLQNFPRQALHACSLGLVHPDSREALSWDIALPEDIQTLILALENAEKGSDTN